MPDRRGALLILLAGFLAFAIVYSFLQFSPSKAEPAQVSEVATPPSGPTYALAPDSLVLHIEAGQEAIGVPTSGFEALLRDVQPGDRLDVVASLTSPQDAQPLTAVVVRGATVLRAITPATGDPLIVEVAAPDAVMLAHLEMNGTHLAYILWPASGGGSDSMPPAVDDRAVRDALGLSSATPTPAVTVAPTAATVSATAARGPGSGFLYQVQPNDTWDSIAWTFGINTTQLRVWNEATNAADPAPGSLVFIPRPS